MQPDQPPEVLCESTFLRLMRNGCWEYVQRTNSKAAVVIVPFTNDGKVVFIEQFRVPLQASVIEFPAGMVGDDPGSELEALCDAARRELVEETGYDSLDLREVFVAACLAGMTDEMVTFYIAVDLKKIERGGGVGHEQISVIEVPLADVDTWLASQVDAGKIMDARLFTGLYLLRRELKLAAK